MRSLFPITRVLAILGAFVLASLPAVTHAKAGSANFPPRYTCTVTINGVTSTQSFADGAAEDHWEALYGPQGGTCTGD